LVVLARWRITTKRINAEFRMHGWCSHARLTF
jgi:hypothetical protein